MISVASLKITFDILNLIAEIDEFKGAWRSLGQIAPERLNTLQLLATGATAAATMRIEGGNLGDQEALTLLESSPAERAASEYGGFIAGYLAAQDSVFRNYMHLPFTESTVTQLHSDLSNYSEFARPSSQVYSHTAAKKPVDLTNATRAYAVCKASVPMSLPDLIAWVNKSLADKKVHPLLVTAIFNAVFLAIQPCEDLNGCVADLLVSFLLMRSGYHYMPYGSLQSIIENKSVLYFNAIRQTNESLSTGVVNWNPSLLLFLRMLQQHKHKLEQKLDRHKDQLNRMPEISMQLMELIKANGRITISEAVAVTRISRLKVQKHLDMLVAEYQLQKQGTAKAMWYSLNT